MVFCETCAQRFAPKFGTCFGYTRVNWGELSAVFREKSVHVWHGSFSGMAHSCVTWLIHVWHDLFMFDMVYISLTWLIHVWHDPLGRNSWIENSRVTWLSDFFDMTHSCVTSLIHVCRASLFQTFWNECFLLWQRHTYRCDKLQNTHTDVASCSLYICIWRKYTTYSHK